MTDNNTSASGAVTSKMEAKSPFCGFPDCQVQGEHYHNGQQRPGGDYVDLPARVVITLQQQQATIERLTRELDVQKAVVDLAYIPHRNLVESRDNLQAKHDKLERKVTAIVAWLEANQPDVFRRGLWDAVGKGADETSYPISTNTASAVSSEGASNADQTAAGADLGSKREPSPASADWRPIETGPHGGEWVLLWWPGITDCALVGYRNLGKWKCPIGSWEGYTEGEDNKIGGPTHWMPLPKAPTCGQEKSPCCAFEGCPNPPEEHEGGYCRDHK